MPAQIWRDLEWFVEHKLATEFMHNLNKRPWKEELSFTDNLREVAVMTIDRIVDMASDYRAQIELGEEESSIGQHYKTSKGENNE